MESQPPASSPSSLSNTTASSHHPSSPTKSGTKCECQCDPQCKCNCPCIAHCVCLWKHDHECGPKCNHVCKEDSGCTKSPRNLIVCLDGTTNQFGHWVCDTFPPFARYNTVSQNTNVVELYNRILKKGEKDANQLTFYSSGIGTYVPSTARPRLSTWYYNTIDSAIAR